MSKLQRGIESLYSAASLTDELQDEDAKSLLKWGEGMAAQLATDDTDDDTYDEQMKQVRRVIKRVNRFIGAQGQGDTEEARKNLEKLIESAAELGVNIPQEQVDKLMDAQSVQSMGATLGPLVDALSGKAADTTQAADPPAANNMGTMLAGLRGRADDELTDSDGTEGTNDE